MTVDAEGLTYAQALAQAATLDSPSARADVELLLSAATGVSRTSFFTWPERQLTASQSQRFQDLLNRRRAGMPVAYLTGSRGFRGLDLLVNPATLIPRPDTEIVVDLARSLFPNDASISVLDLGTGSGAIALALAQERPQWHVLATDRSVEALLVAKANAQRHGLANVGFLESDWFAAVAGAFDLVVSNPPYIRQDDEHLCQGDLRFEPSTALAAGVDGLDDVRVIVREASAHLNATGWLVLEHGYDQAPAVSALLIAAGFVEVRTVRDYGDQDRATCGRKSY